MKKLFFYITLFALSNLYSYSNEASGVKAQAKAPQTTFQFAVQKKAFFFEKKDYKFRIKKAYLAKGDKGVLTTIEDGYGLAIYTNATGTETIGWLNLCDLTVSFSFAQNPTLQFSTVEKRDTFFFNNEHTNFIAFDLLFTYPSYYENGDLAKLQQQFIENAFGEDYKTVTPENVLQKYVANTVSAYTDEAMDEVAYNFTRHNKLLWLEGNLLHYEDNSWEYTGGAQGYGDTEHRIIDLSAYTNSNLDYLKKYTDSDYDKLFDSYSIFAQRLVKLIGMDKFNFLDGIWTNVTSSIRFENNVFVAEGNADVNFIVVYDFSTDVMCAGINDGDVEMYSENGKLLPIVKEWAGE